MGQKLGNATKTTLALGQVSAPVALYRTVGEAKDVKYDTAGPNGRELRYEDRSEEAPPEEVAVGDPLGVQEEYVPPLQEAADRAVVTEIPLSAPGCFRQVLVEDGSGVEVTREEVRRGLRREGSFIDLTDGLREIEEATKLEEMRVISFIRVEQVPRGRVTGSYWVAPDAPGGAKVLRILRDAMRLRRRVAVVKWTKRSKQALGVLGADRSGGLLLMEVAFADLRREPDAKVLSPLHAEVTAAEVRAACDLIDAMADAVASLDEVEDDAVVLRRELLARAQAGEEFRVPERPAPAEDVSVLDAFRASV